jgi:putative membrane protein
LSAVIAWGLGAALLAGLVALNHPERVLGAVAALKLWLLLVIAFHAVPFDTVGWRRLLAKPRRLGALFAIRWLGEGVNGLFPVPHLGELLRVELASRGDGEAGASVVVDLTLGVTTEVLFALVGLALLAAGSRSSGGVLATAVVAGGALAAYLLQRTGIFARSAGLLRRFCTGAGCVIDIEGARALDERVRALYGRPADLLAAGAWRLVGWVASAGETWLILCGLGHPLGFADAVIIESLSQAARTAAFATPGGLGVQDGALLLLAGQLGLNAETGLALSLAKRCRELALGVPGLAAGSVIVVRRFDAAGAERDRRPPA